MEKKPPLADISPFGRAAATLKRFQAGILKELDREIGGLSEEGEKSDLGESKARLQEAVGQMIELAKVDPLRGVQIMNNALALMFASADAASRIDRRRIPQIINKAHGRPGGKESGKKRRDKAEKTWKIHAQELAKQIRSEEPGITQVNLAGEIAERWKLPTHCPETQLILAIRVWEKSGGLARRNK